ncbi:MAG TPA: hypothetical protein VMZ53_06880 [Kofleriaceae bacterium]|nr:hypothetical protein [Kofleriaceae bacterium]
MDPQTDSASARSDAGAQRRWLIGIAITVVFGIFGAVMALLAYTNSSSAPPSRVPGPSRASEPATTPPSPDEPRNKGHGKDHGRK